MIDLENVSKKLERFALKDISLKLPKGYIYGLIGSNGAGKTTLLHLLMGLYKQDCGDLKILGKDFDMEEAAIHNEIGVVLQERLFDNYMTLQENTSYYGKFYANYDEKYLLQLLEQYGLNPREKYRRLSKGEELKFQLCAQPRAINQTGANPV